jgi:hypothetical protein
LTQRYKHMRRVRGDGNCFYRAVIFAQCERALNDADVAKQYGVFYFVVFVHIIKQFLN